MAIRTNVTPTVGPARLLFAFEAVIIGGLGNLWGTLAGGVILGVAQSVGAKIHPGFPDPRRPHRLPGRARDPPERPVPEVEGLKLEPAMSDEYRVVTTSTASRITLISFVVIVIVLATGPWWLGRAEMRLGVEICTYLALATMWNLLAGYAGLVSVGQQAFVGVGGYALFALAAFAGVHPLLALVLAESSPRSWPCPPRPSPSGSRAPTSPSAPGSSPRSTCCRSPRCRFWEAAPA